MYLGMDIGTSGVKAVLVNEAGAIVATAARELALVASRAAVVRAGSGRLGRCGDRRRRRSCVRSSARRRAGAWHRSFRPDARRHACSARTAVRCVRRSCGMMAARMPNARGSSERCPSLHAIAGNLAMPGFTAPKLLWVARHEPEMFRAGRKGAAAEGLCPLPPDRRDGRGHVGRRRHALARCRPAPLVCVAAACHRARSPPHAAPGRRQ